MKSFLELEGLLQNRIFPDLEKGRPGWDLPHTQAVVYYMKKLLHFHPGLDYVVMLISAYAHDWGYAGLFTDNDSPDLEDIKKYKPTHMIEGARMVKELMEGEQIFCNISQESKDRIIHLVSVHDKLDGLGDEDELVLMEADTLGALDINFVTPTFTAESNIKFMESTNKNRISRFITPEASEWAEKLFAARQRYYQQKFLE